MPTALVLEPTSGLIRLAPVGDCSWAFTLSRVAFGFIETITFAFDLTA